MDEDEVAAEFGDYVLDLEDDESTVREVLEPQGGATYQFTDEVKQSLLNMVGDDAVGREGYTDRGGHAGSADEEAESIWGVPRTVAEHV